MLPDQRRLLAGARAALAGISSEAAPGTKAVFDSVDAVLIELLLRCDSAFYVGHYADGVALAQAGVDVAQRAALSQSNLLAVQVAVLLPFQDKSLSAELAWTDILSLRVLLVNIVEALSIPALENDPTVKIFLEKVVDWENAFHARHLEFARVTQVTPKPETDFFSKQNIETYLRQKFPDWGNLAVGNISVLAGGFSKKTVLIDVADEVNGARSLVIRAEQPPRFGFWDGDQVENEFTVLRLVHEAGLPVAEPLWLETDRRHLGQKFLVSRKAEGGAAGSAVGATAVIAPEMIEDLIRQLVRIHQTKLDRDDPRLVGSHLKDWARYKTLTESTTAWVAHWVDCIKTKQLRPSPLTSRLMAWLRNNVPVVDEAPSFLHGDFGLHNALFSGNAVSCVLDWEYATFGDPAEDIALLSISLGDSMTKQRIMELYQGFGGRPISAFRLRYFDVLYSMKFIVPCENGLKLYQDNEEANIGLCRWGFQYTHAGVGALNEKIALAEQAKLGPTQ